jgi:hypothetical protein
MSKMDNLRAMREARYEADRARAKAAGSTPATKPTRPGTESAAGSAAGATAPRSPRQAPAPKDAKPASGDALCGHRNMGGRTCTRELGHAAKSHRYS